MPVICVNPTNEIEAEIINKLSLQNQDLRLFVSNKNEENYINKLQGKKAVGDVTDDTHISTCLLYTSPSPRDRQKSRMPSSA